MSRIRIDNARILDPADGRDEIGTVCIEGNLIRSVFKSADKFTADISIDAGGKWLAPGIVDLSARLAKPGQDIKYSITTEAAAAVGAGVTTLCCPPDSHPVIDTPAAAELFLKAGTDSGKVRILPIAALTPGLDGNRLAEMFTLKQSGCVAVSNANRPLDNYEILRRALEYAASTDLTVFIHPEDRYLRNNGVVNEGTICTRLGLPPIPETAETVAVSATLLLAEQTGVRVHFCRLSSARAVEMIRQAKNAGLAVTADVDICHLYLTDLDIDGYNANCHLVPPLRRMEDRDALIRGLADGVIDAVCSDHRLLGTDSKIAPFSLTEPGASTIELLLPLMLDLSQRKKLSLVQAFEKITRNPASILGLPYGQLRAGSPADIIIIDPDRTWTVDSANLRSAGKCTPFEGWQMQGKVCYTVLGGELVYQDEE